MKISLLYPFRDGKVITWRRVKDIDYLQGDDKCTRFHFANGKVITETGSIGMHALRLIGTGFFCMIHRSFTVNLKAIREVKTDGTVLLRSGIDLLCAKTRLDELLQRFNIL